jgi:hypothetical protein
MSQLIFLLEFQPLLLLKVVARQTPVALINSRIPLTKFQITDLGNLLAKKFWFYYWIRALLSSIAVLSTSKYWLEQLTVPDTLMWSAVLFLLLIELNYVIISRLFFFKTPFQVIYQRGFVWGRKIHTHTHSVHHKYGIAQRMCNIIGVEIGKNVRAGRGFLSQSWNSSGATKHTDFQKTFTSIFSKSVQG